jgi:hypothetical protein
MVSPLTSLVEFNRRANMKKRNSKPSIRKEATNPEPVIPDESQKKPSTGLESTELTDSSLEQGLLGMLPGEKINEFWERRKKDSQALLHRIKARLPELGQIWEEHVADQRAEEDMVYRYYHQSNKVYGIQTDTEAIVKLLQEVGHPRALNSEFLAIIQAGAGKKFRAEHNRRWNTHTLPQLQAFWHAKYFLEQLIKYGKELDTAPNCLPSGWASVLYLYNLR